jgi:uncharacterized membrane protein HdeD (DUF308 family)
MKRPIAVTVIGCVFIAAGVMGVAYHFSDKPFDGGAIALLAVRVLAIVAGVYLLMGKNWARWVALGWMGFHVGVSAFHSVGEFAMHSVLMVVIGYFLVRPPGSEYFRGQGSA